MCPCRGIFIALCCLPVSTLALTNLALLLLLLRRLLSGSLLRPLFGFPLPVRTGPTRTTRYRNTR
jgi:hypothetical protein